MVWRMQVIIFSVLPFISIQICLQAGNLPLTILALLIAFVHIITHVLADKCEIQLSYAIGVAQPTSINLALNK